MPAPSTFNSDVILHRLGPDRLASYLDDSNNDLERGLNLYAWNAQIAAAFLEDLGRLEVVLRNRFDEALTELVKSAGHSSHWFDQAALFPGRGSRHILRVIGKAKRRATRGGMQPLSHDEVITELGFGFWRFLCAERYLTSLWSPALASQFPHHPSPDNAVQIRADIDSRMGRLHFLRNRVAHHKPIHRRDLADDAALLMELVRWMCADTHGWMASLTRIPSVLASRPV